MTQTEKVSLQRLYSVGLAVKLGKQFEASQWGAFASVGLLSSKFRLRQDVSGENANGPISARSSTTSTRLGIAPGVGIVYHGIEKVCMRFEYACEIYQTVNGQTLANISATGENFRSRINPVYHTLMVTLSRKF
jgi:hypothetical protein